MFLLGLAIYGIYSKKHKEFVITGNLNTRSDIAQKSRISLTTSSTYLKLILVVFKPYMDMNISLHIALSECSTIIIDPCKEIDVSHKSHGYFLVKSSYRFNCDPHYFYKLEYTHAKQYFALYKDLCHGKIKFPNKYELLFPTKYHVYKLQIQEDTCVTIHILSTSDAPISEPSTTYTPLGCIDKLIDCNADEKYEFSILTCNYSLIISKTNGSKYNKLMFSGNQISTNLNLMPDITVFTENSKNLMSETSTMQLTGDKIYLEYNIAGVYTHIPTVFSVRPLKHHINRTAYDITFDTDKLLIINKEIMKMLKHLLTDFHKTLKPLKMPCRKIEFKLSLVNTLFCPYVTVMLVFFHGLNQQLSDWWLSPYEITNDNLKNIILITMFNLSINSVSHIYTDTRVDRIVNNKSETLPYVLSIHLSKENRKVDNLTCSLKIKVSNSNTCFNQLLFQNRKPSLPWKLQFDDYSYHRFSFREYWKVARPGERIFRHVTWDEANWLCKYYNLTLPTLADAEEEEHILSMLFGKFYHHSMEAFLIPLIYLGLKSVHQVFFGILHN